MVWTIESMARGWLGKNEVLSDVRNIRKSSAKKLDNEHKKQEKKLAKIEHQIKVLTEDKVKVLSLISDLKAEKTALNKG